MFGEYGTEFVPVVEFGKMTDEQRLQARAVVQQYFIAMPVKEINSLIARLQIIAPEKVKPEYDIKARTAFWIEELRKYPADIVRKVLKMRYRWFPSLAEVLENCENEIAFRKLIARGLRVSNWE